MSKRYGRVVIEDIEANGVSPDEESQLLDVLEYVVKTAAVTQARFAVFNTSDIRLAGQRGVAGFELTVRRLSDGPTPSWRGSFRRDAQYCHVLASLE